MDKPQARILNRRKVLQLGTGSVAAAILGSAINAVAIEPRWLDVTSPAVQIADLPTCWEGTRIAHLTDLHIGRLVSLDYIGRVVDVANAACPDIVVLTGDLVTNATGLSDDIWPVLAGLNARDGKYAVLGNHDHWSNGPLIIRGLSEAGFTILTNASRLLTRNGEPLCIAGVDDLLAGRPNIALALTDVERTREHARTPRIVLCHNPDYAEMLPPVPHVDLMLSGHTHGGQIKLPAGPRPKLPIRHAKYAAGLVRGPRCQVYVSVGLGMVGVPVRFNCRPELALITLRKGKPSA